MPSTTTEELNTLGATGKSKKDLHQGGTLYIRSQIHHTKTQKKKIPRIHTRESSEENIGNHKRTTTWTKS